MKNESTQKHTHTLNIVSIVSLAMVSASAKEINNLFENGEIIYVSRLSWTWRWFLTLYGKMKMQCSSEEKNHIFLFILYFYICNSSAKPFLTFRCGSIYDWRSTWTFLHFIEIRNFYSRMFILRLATIKTTRQELFMQFKSDSWHNESKRSLIKIKPQWTVDEYVAFCAQWASWFTGFHFGS